MRRGLSRLSRIGTLALGLLLILGLASCNKSETQGASDTTTSVATLILSSRQNKSLEDVLSYVESCVNGDFREFVSFPLFTDVSQIPPDLFSGSALLKQATSSVGLSSMSRSNYEQYLQQHFNRLVTLPANASYSMGYDKTKDVYSVAYEKNERNFVPFSTFLDAEITTEGDKIYLDAYELAYEFVNKDTGREEYDNPIARMVVDEVTVGFSVPIVRRDLYLIDYRELAKTRYILQLTEDGSLNMMGKTMLQRNENFKYSAQAIWGQVMAKRAQASGLGGMRLNVRDWASNTANIMGTLDEGTRLWTVDVLPQTAYVLGAPAAYSAVFDYKLGFGFVARQYSRAQ